MWCRSEALEPDVVAYNTTVRALSVAGHLQAAVDTLGQLTGSGHRARTASFLPLLAGTATSGSVRSVLELWVQMQRMNVTLDISCSRAFALAMLRSGNRGAHPPPDVLGWLSVKHLAVVVSWSHAQSRRLWQCEVPQIASRGRACPVHGMARVLRRLCRVSSGVLCAELIEEALSRMTAQMSVMSSAKASAEASGLVLDHAEHVSRDLWAAPGMTPFELFHTLSHPQGARKGGDVHAALAASRGHGREAHTVRPHDQHDRQQRPGQASSPLYPPAPPAAPPLGMMYVVPQAVRARAPANGISQFSVNVAYPTVGALGSDGAAAPVLVHGMSQAQATGQPPLHPAMVPRQYLGQ